MPRASYKKLKVWRRAMDLVEAVYVLTRNFPAEEKSGLSATLRRAAAALPAKIADGRGRLKAKVTPQSLAATRASLVELTVYFDVATRLRMGSSWRLFTARRRAKKLMAALEQMLRAMPVEGPAGPPAKEPKLTLKQPVPPANEPVPLRKAA